MKTELIFHQPSNRRLLLIFSGWSTTPDLYSDLKADGWDIMLVYDYSSLDFDIRKIEDYSTVYVVAWSLGVAAAEYLARRCFTPTTVSAAFALNGTLHPADDETGIPTAIFDGTAERLDMRNLRRFRHRMSGPRDPYRFPEDSGSAISCAETESEELLIARLRNELITLRDILKDTRPEDSAMRWKRAYISTSDLIFPPAAQRRGWEAHPDAPQIVELQAGHYVPLQQIISEITPDHSRISRRFSKAIPTYSDNALAQNIIALHLAEQIEGNLDDIKDLRMLEIGAGSGSLTHRLAERIHPAEATFVDLYELPRFGIAPRENYVVADAEEWMENGNASTYHLIASASTMQWFADPDRFFGNAARALAPGGILLCSTYLPGNLAELDPLRPAPLIYRSRGELMEMLQRHFRIISLHEESVFMDFDSPREALMHLKNTGVGGGTTAMTRHLLTSLPRRPRFTYRPLYIKAIK